MEVNQEAIAAIRREMEKFIPQLSINCVIFRFDGDRLQVPVVQPLNVDIWTVPGGFIYQNESIDVAAKRIIFEQTQLDNLLLSQFGTIGSADREFSKEFQSFITLGIPADLAEWISRRFVTIGYYSVVGKQQIELKTGPLFKDAKWIPIEEREKLALDHSLLVSEALKTLRNELQSKPLLSSFMPKTFTIPELQKLYEAILGRPVDRGNFRQRMLKLNFLIKIGTTKEKTKSRPPIIYKLDKKEYVKSLNQDVKLGF